MMDQCGNGDPPSVRGNEHVGQEVLHAAGERRIELADMQHPHAD